MYAIFAVETGTVLDVTADRALAHEWCERHSRLGGLFLVLWGEAIVAAFRNGEPVEVRWTSAEPA